MLENLSAAFTLWIQSDIYIFKVYVAFLASFFTGEGGGVLVLTYAFDQLLDLPTAFIAVFLGFLCADIFWFIVVKLSIRTRLFRNHFSTKLHALPPLRIFIFEYAKKHPYTILLFSKFIAGLRLILMIYIVSQPQTRWWKYLIFNILGDLFFTIVLLGIAKGIHVSSTPYLDIQSNISHIILLFIVIGVVSQILVQSGRYAFTHFSKTKKY
jgi:membrane protein DedA with SNARE-associated domain